MALTIKERFITGRGVGKVGTLSNPIPIETTLVSAEGSTIELPMRLGFEAIPSTQYLGLDLDRHAELQVCRIGDDPYLNSVAVGLIGPDDTRAHGGGPIVHTQDGISGWHGLTPGFWWLAVAVGMRIDISFRLTILVRPRRLPLAAESFPAPLSSVAILASGPLRAPFNSPGGNPLEN